MKLKLPTREKHKHYVVYSEEIENYAFSHCVVGVYHSEEAAQKAFKERVNSVERKLAENCRYDIYTDNDKCFAAGEDGEYVVDHVAVYILESESGDADWDEIEHRKYIKNCL